MKMPLGSRPRETLYKRSAYKTEFDIFKQNSQLDLISLLSFDDNDASSSIEAAKNIHARNRPLYEKSSSTKTATRRPPYSHREFVRSRAWIEYKRQGLDVPRGKSEVTPRVCKSAFGSTTRTSKPCFTSRDARLRSKSNYSRRTNVESSKTNKSDTPTSDKRAVVKDDANDPVSTVTKQNVIRTDNISEKTNNNSVNNTRAKTAGPLKSVRTNSGNSSKPACKDISSRRSSVKSACKSTASSRSFCRSIHERCTVQKNQQKQFSLSKTHFCEDESVNSCSNLVSGQGSLKRSESREDCDSEPSWISGDYKGIRSPVESEADVEAVDVSEENDNIASRDSGFCSKTTSPDTKYHRAAIDEESAQYIKTLEQKGVTFDIDNFGVSSDEDDGCEKDNDEPASDATNVDVGSDKRCGEYTDFVRDLNEFGNGADIFDRDLAKTDVEVRDPADLDSLLGDHSCQSEQTQEVKDCDGAESLDVGTSEEIPGSGMSDRKMSNEARHAIFETLQDMRLTGKRDRMGGIGADVTQHQGVSAKRRLSNNRHQYKYYLRERTNTMLSNKTMDVDETYEHENRRRAEDDINASTNIELPDRDTASPEQCRVPVIDRDAAPQQQSRVSGILLPSIGAQGKSKKSDNAASHSNVVTLDHVKKRKYKIPGIGNYNLVASPDQEFEITPAGFDSRYNVGPAISEAERDPPPKFVQDHSINKCKKWLRNVSLTPLSLKPVKSSKSSSTRR